MAGDSRLSVANNPPLFRLYSFEVSVDHKQFDVDVMFILFYLFIYFILFFFLFYFFYLFIFFSCNAIGLLSVVLFQ